VVAAGLLTLVYVAVLAAVGALVANRIAEWERDVKSARIDEIVLAGGVSA